MVRPDHGFCEFRLACIQPGQVHGNFEDHGVRLVLCWNQGSQALQDQRRTHLAVRFAPKGGIISTTIIAAAGQDLPIV